MQGFCFVSHPGSQMSGCQDFLQHSLEASDKLGFAWELGGGNPPSFLNSSAAYLSGFRGINDESSYCSRIGQESLRGGAAPGRRLLLWNPLIPVFIGHGMCFQMK